MGHNVAEEASVVDDAYLMGAFLISKHAHPTFEIVDPDFDVGMPPKIWKRNLLPCFIRHQTLSKVRSPR
jgi:hypothetical protein